ncbi:MAG: GNAT family N-acetyltransferase [Nitrososphaerales archaeon]
MIREAKEQDLRSILEIYNDAVLTTSATFDLEPVSFEARKAWFCEHGGKYPLVVAEIEGKVVGYSCVSPYAKKAGYSKTVELSVYVHKSYRNKGIGKLLVSEIIERSRKLGYHAIVSGISGSNYGSEILHRKAGFELRGYMKQIGYKFSSWQDVAFYELIL